MIDPLQQPALIVPLGVISQFPTTHSNHQKWFYVCVTLCAVVSGTLLALRLYTKLYIVRKVDLIDYIVITSFFFFIALIICGRMCLAEGAGVHQWNLRMHNFIGITYWLYIDQIIYAPTIFLIKVAILLQYLRLFAPQRILNPFMWYSARIIIVVTGIYYTVSTFITIFACSPREAIWNPFITDYKCFDNNTLVFITCLFNIVSDIVILLLPARAVWKLRISIKKEVEIVLLFAIGLLACVANVMIIIYVIHIGDKRYDSVYYNSAGQGTWEKNADLSYYTIGEGLWAFAEITFGIIVACIFSLPKFIEAEGIKLRSALSSLTRPFTSLTSLGSYFGNPMQSKKGTTASQEMTLDRTTIIIGHSKSDLHFGDRNQNVERYPSEENSHEPKIYSSINPTNIPHQL